MDTEIQSNRSQALDLRLKRFKKLFDGLPHSFPLPGVAVLKLSSDVFEDLRISSMLYLSKVLKLSAPELNEELLMKKFLAAQEALTNITPTGMILPKNYSILENNLLMNRFYRAIDSTGIGERIDRWQIPMHIRVKFPFAEESNLNRPRHAPEDRHIDSWSGYSSKGITTLVPLLGDVGNNCVEFFPYLSPHIDETWYSSPKTKEEQKRISANYAEKSVPVDFVKGTIVMFDATVLHATCRTPDCGIRFSIDNIHMPKSDHYDGIVEAIEAPRVMEQMTHESLSKIGVDRLFYFPDSDDQRKDSLGGCIDPTNFRLIEF
jgi:hypothetical protein